MIYFPNAEVHALEETHGELIYCILAIMAIGMRLISDKSSGLTDQ